MTLPDALETPVQRWTEGFGGRSRPLSIRAFDLSAPPADDPLFPYRVGDLGAGRNMAFRRSLLTELGGFDPALGPGSVAHDGDDIEALLRVLLAGHVIVHDPAATVWHAHPDSWKELEDRVWGYGIGLTACLTKAVIERPRVFFDLARKAPRGFAFALSRGSDKNVGRQQDFPAQLARRELLGFAYGPIAYLRSRRHARRQSRPGGAPPSGPLRVLLVCDEYPPVVGGAGHNLALLAHQLAQRGHKVAVATSWQPGALDEEWDDGIMVRRLRDLFSRVPSLSDDPHRHHPPPFPDPEAVSGIRRAISDFEPDLIHAYGWMSAAAAVALRGSRTPLILSTHDYGNVCAIFTLVLNGEACSGPAPTKCVACATATYGPAKASVAVASIFGARALLRRRTSAIQSVSHFTADTVNRYLRVPGVTPRVIPNFLDVDTTEPVDEEILAALPDEPFLLFVGHLRTYKGIEVLLDAYQRLDSPPPLVMIGTIGPDTPATFPPGVEVFTFVPHGTVMEMWRRCLFGISPSIAPEALPSVVLEAMGAGKPMIGSAIGGYGDMIENGKSGLLVPPGDAAALAEAISRLAGDEGLRTRLGERAAQRAREFTPAAVVPQIEHLYRETLAGAERR